MIIRYSPGFAIDVDKHPPFYDSVRIIKMGGVDAQAFANAIYERTESNHALVFDLGYLSEMPKDFVDGLILLKDMRRIDMGHSNERVIFVVYTPNEEQLRKLHGKNERSIRFCATPDEAVSRFRKQ